MSRGVEYNENNAYAYFKKVREMQHKNNLDFLNCKGVHG